MHDEHCDRCASSGKCNVNSHLGSLRPAAGTPPKFFAAGASTASGGEEDLDMDGEDAQPPPSKPNSQVWFHQASEGRDGVVTAAAV